MSASVPPEDKHTGQTNGVEIQPSAPMPVMLPLDIVPALSSDSIPGSRSGLLAAMKSSSAPASNTGSAIVGKKRLKHWTVNRVPTSRYRTKDIEDNDESSLATASRLPKRQRVGEVSDYGPFALLMGSLAKENGTAATEMESAYGTEAKFLEELRSSLSLHPVPRSEVYGAGTAKTSKDGRTSRCSNGLTDKPGLEALMQNALDAEEYLREVVYGGIDGYAYARSVAEFVDAYDSDDVCAPDQFHLRGRTE